MSTWDDKPNDYEHALEQIASLQNAAANWKKEALRIEALNDEIIHRLYGAARIKIDKLRAALEAAKYAILFGGNALGIIQAALANEDGK
jgi:hypothetical protein